MEHFLFSSGPVANTEVPSIHVVHSLGASLRDIKARVYGTSVHFPLRPAK